MRSDGDQRPLPCQVLVQLVLQVDEGGVAVWGEGDASKDGTRKVWPYLRGLERHGEMAGKSDGAKGRWWGANLHK